jgi:hypothetical protein
MDIDRSLIDDDVISPYEVEELLPVEYSPWLHRKSDKQPEFLRPELELGAVHAGAAAIRLDLKVTPVEHPWRSRSGHGTSSNRRPNPGKQLAKREWLDDVVVGAELETVDLVLLLATRRQHEYRNIVGLADMPQDPQTIDPRQHHVEDDQVQLMPVTVDDFDSARASGRDEDAIPLTVEVERQRASQRWVILNQKDRGILPVRLLCRLHASLSGSDAPAGRLA